MPARSATRLLVLPVVCAVSLMFPAGLEPSSSAPEPEPVAGSSRLPVERSSTQQSVESGPRELLTRGRRFWTHDRHFYSSRWFAGRHRKMVPFGCTRAPYYAPSPRCRDDRGFHHGLDIAMACGTKLYAGLRGTVVDPTSRGALGPAYGAYAFRLRNSRLRVDLVIGHVLQVYVHPGDHVARGTLMARASDQGAPDGCHLHFEVRPRAGSYDSAVPPHDYLHLHRRRR